MVVETQLMTVEAFWEQYAGKPFELVHGKVVEVSPAGKQASAIAARTVVKIGIYLETNPIGIVTGADGGFRFVGRNLRAPDAAYYTHDKAALDEHPETYASFPPDLAVEVVSPNDSATEVLDKVSLYLDSGVLLVWVVYPKHKVVVVHHPDRTARTYTVNDTLTGEDVLPGFTLPVADIFSGLA